MMRRNKSMEFRLSLVVYIAKGTTRLKPELHALVSHDLVFPALVFHALVLILTSPITT